MTHWNRRIERIALVLWPSFIVGGIGTICFFSLFDPETLPFSDTVMPFSEHRLADDRMLVYSVGFFLFWMFAAASSWLTSFLQRSPAEVNRESLDPRADSQFEKPSDGAG
jgi:hypothetical protein